MYKLLALDLDGTTLNSNHMVDKITTYWIKKLINNDIKVTIISGREPRSVIKVANDLEIAGYLGAMNGGIVLKEPNKEIVFNKTLLENDVLYTLDKCNVLDYVPIVLIGDDAFVDNRNNPFAKLMDRFADKAAIEVGDLREYLTTNRLLESVNKIIVSDEYDRLVKFQREFNSSDDTRVFFSLPFFLEINPKEISKGIALKFISESYGIDPSEILAVGDGENDIAMLEFSGKSIAMQNAMEGLRKVADEFTTSNDDYGVARVIKKYFFS
ncbi:Cof-type HAD-IIB family hydrolase [Lagierella sp.]|uniref:Cof-type HAD-IIB family hydrolase n=1 Tax=Lagierella sp. TaxID=2849657 RepID=UPI0026204F2F|nr:Cof-type HAD-IIB family hydrolase [Lagierella sp.]